MNLTLQSLNKIKEDSSNKAIEDLLVAADRYDLVEGMHFVNSQVNTAISVISNLNEAKAQLESMGYSDEWFNELMSNESFKTVLELDMPKFFDNNDNRQKACMEGFINTIASWVIKAIKFIVNLANSIIKAIEKIADFFSGNAIDSVKGIADTVGKMCNDEAVKAWFNEHGMKIAGYYDTSKYIGMVDNVIALMEALIPCVQNPFDNNIIPTNRSVTSKNVDVYAVRKEFIARIVGDLGKRSRKCADIDKDGFVLKADPSGVNFIEMYGVKSGKEFRKSELTIDVIEDLKNVVDAPLKNFSIAIDHLSKMLGDTKSALHSLIGQYNQLEADIDNDTNLSTDEYNAKMNECQCHIAATQICESILCQITRFAIKVKHICRYNTILIQNSLKIVKPTP